MTTFGLVHGGFHGAWCWDRLIPALAERGHDAIAMDMPIDDADATLSDYVDSVVDALAPVTGPVVLVGHSLAGLVIPHVPRLRPVERLVFLAAMVDNLPGLDRQDGVTIDRNAITFDGQVTTISAAGAAAAFFGHCEPSDIEWATAQLRPQGPAPRTPLVAPWPQVPTTVILCTDDRAQSADYQRAVARQLGVKATEMPGDHSPFLSRPGDLADVLVTIAAGRPSSTQSTAQS